MEEALRRAAARVPGSWRRTVPTTAWVALAAATAVTLISTLQLLATDLLAGRDPSVLELIARQGLAALAWLGAAVGVVWLSRRVPVRREGAIRALAIHGGGILLVAAAVNLLIPAFWALAGLWAGSGASFFERALAGFSEFLHVNALVYIVVSGAVQLAAHREEDAPRGNGAGNGHVRRLAIPGEHGVTMVDADAIRWVEAAGDYVRVHLSGGSRLLSERMWALERKLDPDRFVRVHRSAIVRLTAVKEVRPLASGDAIAVLEGGEEVRVSRRRRRGLLDRL